MIMIMMVVMMTMIIVWLGKSGGIIALCGYPLVKMELEIQTRFLPRLPFSCNSIISDKIWRKMSLSLSIFLVLPQISLVKYYETIKILMQIFEYFRSHFHNEGGDCEKSYFEVFSGSGPICHSQKFQP